MTLAELLDRAPWREAVQFRDTWPHEYIRLRRDNQHDLSRPYVNGFSTAKGSRAGSSPWTTSTCSSVTTNTG